MSASLPRPLLEVQNLRRRFEAGAAAVDGVSFQVAEGELVALLGPSGCGKTTTLRLIAGFETPDAGDVRLRGESITDRPPEKRGIGFVFQDYALFPHLSVLENVRFGLRNWPRLQARERAMEMLTLVGLDALHGRQPHELSGGQQQRVALARTLALAPPLVLLDEPFSNLDASMRVETRQDVRRLLKLAGSAALLVTHDQEEALVLADRVAVMARGRVVQMGSPDAVYRQPVNAFVAGFIGRANILSGDADGLTIRTALGPMGLIRPVHGPVRVALRPEQICLIPDPGARAMVERREFRGHDHLYQVVCGDLSLLAITPSSVSIALGERVRLQVKEPVAPLEQEGTGSLALERAQWPPAPLHQPA